MSRRRSLHHSRRNSPAVLAAGAVLSRTTSVGDYFLVSRKRIRTGKPALRKIFLIIQCVAGQIPAKLGGEGRGGQ